MRIKTVIKKYGHTQKSVAKKIGISPQGLRLRFKNPTHSSLAEIASAVGCDPIEFLDPIDGYAHWYDEQTGEWLGIRKK